MPNDNNTEYRERLRNALENTLVTHWSSLTDRRSDESKQEFLSRMVRAGFVSSSDYDLIYS